MTTQKLSGLEHARNWMDSLNMRHYGEVDRAIASERAVEHSSDQATASTASPNLNLVQSAGFGPTVCPLTNDSNYLNNAFKQTFYSKAMSGKSPQDSHNALMLWQKAIHTARELVCRDDHQVMSDFVTSVIERKAVVENSTFKITAGGGIVDVCNKQANEIFEVWQGARKNAAFTLCDGTAVELVMLTETADQTESSKLLVSKGSFLAEIDYIDNYFGAGLSIKMANY